MTPEQLDVIQARANAATEGPWDYEPFDGQFGVYSREMRDNGDYPAVVGYPEEGVQEADAEFIAHARTDVPALLAYARDLEARIERGLELHVAEGNGNCVACWDFSNDTDVKYPCPTIAALTATEEA